MRAHLLCLLLLSSTAVESFAGKPRFFNSGSCPYAQRAWIALEECQCDYEKVVVDLENKSTEFVATYAKANPLPGARAKVSLLEVDDTTIICESLVVAEFIAETYGDNNNLLPASPKDRATMRLFTELCGSSFSYFPLLRAKGDKLDAALKTFKEGLVATNDFLKHHNSAPFLFGEAFSLAECNAAPFVQRACIILPAFTSADDGNSITVNPLQICDELGLHNLKAWMNAVIARPSVLETGVPESALMESTKRMLGRFLLSSARTHSWPAFVRHHAQFAAFDRFRKLQTTQITHVFRRKECIGGSTTTTTNAAVETAVVTTPRQDDREEDAPATGVSSITASSFSSSLVATPRTSTGPSARLVTTGKKRKYVPLSSTQSSQDNDSQHHEEEEEDQEDNCKPRAKPSFPQDQDDRAIVNPILNGKRALAQVRSRAFDCSVS
ncbi:glutathione S-transferase, C-terminal domain containing protein [Nitzschia inconspicua]|uniref:Glutathione S-transferase, C-terminal domain containing protein n=1 Tax=Nitzschia inconspicua TaxID=303405 RepID=A0A9K3LZP5_9STRA|nr:glutathione S-transferase, C-terminal domain containing protein [Nitzschia inconspicua]